MTNLKKLFTKNITVNSHITQDLYSTIVHQLFVSYKQQKFHIVIQEENKNLTILQINYTLQFKAVIEQLPNHIATPIAIQEYLSPITLQTLENFEFDEAKICAIFDKMINAKISFNKI